MAIQILSLTPESATNNVSKTMLRGQPFIITSSEYVGTTLYLTTENNTLGNVKPLTGTGIWHDAEIDVDGINVEMARWRFLNFGTNVQLHLGVVANKTLTLPITLFTLPQPAWPEGGRTINEVCAGTVDSVCKVQVTTNGKVVWYNCSNNENEFQVFDNYWVNACFTYPAEGLASPVDGWLGI